MTKSFIRAVAITLSIALLLTLTLPSYSYASSTTEESMNNITEELSKKGRVELIDEFHQENNSKYKFKVQNETVNVDVTKLGDVITSVAVDESGVKQTATYNQRTGIVTLDGEYLGEFEYDDGKFSINKITKTTRYGEFHSGLKAIKDIIPVVTAIVGGAPGAVIGTIAAYIIGLIVDNGKVWYKLEMWTDTKTNKIKQKWTYYSDKKRTKKIGEKNTGWYKPGY